MKYNVEGSAGCDSSWLLSEVSTQGYEFKAVRCVTLGNVSSFSEPWLSFL